MSIVAVHTPNMVSLGAGGAGTGNVTTAPQVKATADSTNGLKFTFQATDTTRAAADYDWAFPGGTPATAADNKGPVAVTYATAGQKTATLTVAAGAGPPAGGAYPITVTAVGTGGPRSVQQDGEPMVTQQDEGGESGFDPSEHSMEEVQAYIEENPDEVETVLARELNGKNRADLVCFLEEQLPFDPADYTVEEVVDYASQNPEYVEDVIELERVGRNRSTLIKQLEAMKTT